MKKLLLLLLIFGAAGVASAQSVRSTLTVPLYHAASCAQLTGTWLGSYTDPQGLLVNRAIRVTLQAKAGQVIGNVKSVGSNDASSINGQLWAVCDHGMLSHVFVGSPKHCGHFAPPGGLMSANTLLLYLPYENAMAETNVFAVLYRENNLYNGSKRSTVNTVPLIHTCH